jgi:hypothetical protein
VVTANNYTITRVNGDFRVVAADQLLVKVDNVTTTYGQTTTYTMASESPKYLFTTGTTVDIVATGGEITSATFNAAGSGLQIGDLLYVNGGSGSAAAGGVLRVDSIPAGGSTGTLSLVTGGSGFAGGTSTALATSKVVALTPTQVGNQFTLVDSANNKASFNLVAVTSAGYQASGSQSLKVGSYEIGYSSLVVTDGNNSGSSLSATANFKDLVVVGRQSVVQKALTPVVNPAASAKTKVYDGTTAMSGLSLSAAAAGVVSGDVVSLESNGGFFNSKQASAPNAKPYTVSGISLDGADASNYYLASNSISGTDGTITPKTLTLTGVQVANKVYDGTPTATITNPGALNDIVAGDVVSIAPTASFNNKTVGDGKTVTLSGLTLFGNDQANYTLATPASLAANITRRTLNVTYSGVSRIYNGNAAATVVTSDDRIAGDTFNLNYTALFNDTANTTGTAKNVGTGKSIAISGASITGGDSSNYTLASGSTSGTTTADIAPATIRLISGIAVSDKTYNKSAAAAISSTANSIIHGMFAGDNLTVNASGATANFVDVNAGSNKTVAITGLSLGGTDAGNYTLANSNSTATATMNRATLTVGGISAANKVYDGTTSASITTGGITLSTVFAGDSVSVDAGAITGAFADKNVGTNKPVTLSGLSLTGSSANNYQISS